MIEMRPPTNVARFIAAESRSPSRRQAAACGQQLVEPPPGSGAPVCAQRTVTVDGKVALRGEMRITCLRIDAPVPAGIFSTDASPGYQVSRRDHQGGHCTVAEAARLLGWTPPQPVSVPSGFALASVSTASLPAWDAPNSVTLTYRSGLRSFTLTLGPAGAMAGPRGGVPPLRRAGG